MDTVKQLIDQYGPAVVAAAQRQVGVAIAQDIAWSVFSLILLGAAAKTILGAVAFFRSDHESYDNREIVWGIGSVIAGFVALFAIVSLLMSVGEIWTFSANPDYAVITIVRKMVLAK